MGYFFSQSAEARFSTQHRYAFGRWSMANNTPTRSAIYSLADSGERTQDSRAAGRRRLAQCGAKLFGSSMHDGTVIRYRYPSPCCSLCHSSACRSTSVWWLAELAAAKGRTGSRLYALSLFCTFDITHCVRFIPSSTHSLCIIHEPFTRIYSLAQLEKILVRACVG